MIYIWIIMSYILIIIIYELLYIFSQLLVFYHMHSDSQIHAARSERINYNPLKMNFILNYRMVFA